MKLSDEQLNRASEILGNIAVAWFSAGVISPLFVRTQNIDLYFAFAISIILSILFFVISLDLIKEVKL